MKAGPSRADLVRYFLRLGGLGFGGPIALVGAMHRDLVERHGWLSPAEYREGMTLAQVSPGPLAAQLCFYIGYVRGGLAGAAATGVAFVLPGFLMVVALGAAYVRFGGMSWMQAAFYGVGAAVTGLIGRSAWRLTHKTLGSDPLLWAVSLTLAATTVATGREPAGLIVASGVLVWFWRHPPAWLRPRARAAEGASLLLLLQLLGFFTYAGAFVFGSGLAIVPFLHGGVVQSHHWLDEAQFLDAVAVAMLTPGPVVITTGFIGYLVAGPAGATVAAAATFLPCFLLTVLPAPWFRRHGDQPWLQALVAGVTAGAVGAIMGAVVVLGRHSLRDGTTIMIALGALLATCRPLRWLPDPAIILAAGLVGVAIRG